MSLRLDRPSPRGRSGGLWDRFGGIGALPCPPLLLTSEPGDIKTNWMYIRKTRYQSYVTAEFLIDNEPQEWLRAPMGWNRNAFKTFFGAIDQCAWKPRVARPILQAKETDSPPALLQ